MNIYKPTLIFTIIIVLTVLTSCVSRSQSNSLSWADDIEVLQKQLPKKHKDLYFSITKKDYQRRLEQIKRKLPQLSDLEVEIELRRVLADVGDAHTSLGWKVEKLYPLDFNWFAEGVFVMAAVPEHTELIGQKLITVNGTPVSELKKSFSEIIPHENEAQLWNTYPDYLVMPKYLHGLGIIEADRAVFEFINQSGEKTKITLDPVKRSKNIQWKRYLGDVIEIPENPGSIPLYLSNSGSYYWKKYIKNEQLLYMQYNGCINDPKKPFKKFAESVNNDLNSNPVKTFVIDLRFNGGGNSGIMQPLIKKLQEDYEKNREYELYVVLGRATFSSAVLNAIELKQKAGAIFVGEPTSGKPNHYGEVRSMKLPYSGLKLSYSTKYFKMYDKEADTLQPDIKVLWSFNNLAEWKDGVMQVIRKQPNEN